MRRLFNALALDIKVQFRNNLYLISVIFGALLGAVYSFISSPKYYAIAIPNLVLMIAGGSTLLYVAGMILFEQDEGTLQALSVSPLTPLQYLGAKVLSLSFLAVLEGLIFIVLLYGLHHYSLWQSLAGLPALLIGLLTIGMLHTLIGIILVVRFQRITDFLVPMAGVALILQLPLFYFTGLNTHPLFLLIPSSPQLLLIQGAYQPLELWQWLYGLVYTGALLLGFSLWAHKAFNKHIILKAG